MIKRGHLYWADLNPQIGTEPGKVRPVLVLQSDYLNECKHASTIVLLCTTNIANPTILRVRLEKMMAGNPLACDVMIDQIRAIDNRRLKKSIGIVPKTILKDIESKLKITLGFGLLD